MKISFTPDALTQLELVIGTLSNDTGFLIGQDMGKIKIIQNLFPINFNENTIDMLYSKIYSKMNHRLMGVFFNNIEPFCSDWFIQDIVINIKYPQPRFYLYDIDKKYIHLPDITV